MVPFVKHTFRSRLNSTTALAYPVLAVALAAGVLLAPAPSFALDTNATPGGEVIVGNGSATFNRPSAGVLDIHQTSDRLVVNWDSFNIGQNAITTFLQPTSDSLAVNRVVSAGSDPTQILGTLRANGKIMILDRNGVLFGANSHIDVGAIVASTGNVDTAQVMSGAQQLDLFDFGNATIENSGRITVTDSGLAAFVAPTVKNSGIIQANFGKVVLAAGNEAATVDLYGDGLVELAYTDKDDPLLSENTGDIQARSGKVLMTAAKAKDVVDRVVNLDGVVNATAASVVNGQIVLSAKTVNVGPNASVLGGTTDIQAQTAALSSTISGGLTGAVDVVDVKNSAAKINQGLAIAKVGGTVNVAPGTYAESVHVDKMVTLLGTDAVIVPNSPGLYITGAGATVSGFEIAAGDNGIVVDGADHVTVSNNIVHNIDGDGILVRNSDNATVANNTIYDIRTVGLYTGSGIQSIDSVALNITGNQISGTQWDGIRLVHSAHAVVNNNMISEVVRTGIYSEVSGNGDISNNGISFAGRRGIHLNYSFTNQVHDNDIDMVGMQGILSFASTGSLIDNNSVDNTGLSGIHLDHSQNNIVSGNVIGANGGALNIAGDGILLDRSNNAFLQYNYIADSASNGINARDVDRLNADQNFITNSAYDGIHINSYGAIAPVDLTLTNNMIAYSGDDGIDITYERPTILTPPVASVSNPLALAVSSGDAAINVIGNTVRNSTDDGIYVAVSQPGFAPPLLPPGLAAAALVSPDTPNVSILIDGNTVSNDGLVPLSENTNQQNISGRLISDTAFGYGDGIQVDVFLSPWSSILTGTTVSNNTVMDFMNNGLYASGPGHNTVSVSGNFFGNNRVGANFESGLIDLMGDANALTGGETGYLFNPYQNFSFTLPPRNSAAPIVLAPSPFFAPMALVNDTIGATLFDGQSSLFVELRNGAFFDPGTPTLLNGVDASYNGFSPSSTGGSLTAGQLVYLESMIHHYVDDNTLGLFFFGSVPEALGFNQEDVFNLFGPFSPNAPSGSLTITGLPSIGGGAPPRGGNPFANIAPAAGSDNPETIEPAAGGTTGGTGGNSPNFADAACWGDATQQLGSGNSVNFNLGDGAEGLLNKAALCGAQEL